MKYFDKQNNRLVFMEKSASPNFWDNQWSKEDFEKTVKTGGGKNKLVIKVMKNFIQPNKAKKILEGGCGNGKFVYAFDKMGYDAYGVDYAQKTIARTKSAFPQLKISAGDVRRLSFSDNYFDGYWSIGVIEHFFEGYGEILKEIRRVIKPGGYLFITFPYMSHLRKLKAKLNLYPIFEKKEFDKKEFYQFALDHNRVIKEFENNNFILLQKTRYNGTKGLKDEILLFKPLFQKIYNSRNIILRILNYGLSLILAIFSSHSILLVFRKK